MKEHPSLFPSKSFISHPPVPASNVLCSARCYRKNCASAWLGFWSMFQRSEDRRSKLFTRDHYLIIRN